MNYHFVPSASVQFHAVSPHRVMDAAVKIITLKLNQQRDRVCYRDQIYRHDWNQSLSPNGLWICSSARLATVDRRCAAARG